MRKIHITESQLKNVLMLMNEQNGVTPIDGTQAFNDDGKTFGVNCKKAVATAASNGLTPDETSFNINGSALKSMEEAFDEGGRHVNFGDVSYDYYGEEGYSELINLLQDIKRNPSMISTLNAAINGDTESERALYNVAKNNDINIPFNMFRYTLRHMNQDEINGYSMVDEHIIKRLTKKQIKEARLRKMMNECKVILRKKDIKK